MRPIKLISFLLLTSLIQAQTLPTKTEILNTLKLVNNAWMANHPQTATTHSAVEWLEGAYFTGHMALFETFPQKENINHAYDWGFHNTWNLGTRKEADNQCVGQAYMDIFVANGSKDNDAMLTKINTSIQNLVNKSATGDWNWIDALYMAMPLITRYGNYYGKSTYLDKAYAMFTNTKVTQQLYNSTDGFWYRDSRFKPPYTTKGGKRCYWSRGNGWVFGSLVRTLNYLPKNSTHRQEYITVFKNMAQALQKVQRTDGFWNVSLADSTEFPGPETSGTGFFTYGLAWGINEGILDSATYMPTVIKAWNGLVNIAIHPDGKVGYVQLVGDQPSSSQPVTYTSYRDYGEGTVLLAGSELVKLAPGTMPLPVDFYIKSVEVINSTTIKLHFYEEVDKTTAENIQNYSINKSVQVQNAVLSENKLSVNLTISATSDTFYGILLQNVKSVSGKTIADRNGKQFKGILTTGISSLKNKNSVLRIYPNPAKSSFIINLKDIANADITIYDMKGRLVYAAKSQTGDIRISNNSIFRTGLYFVKVTDINQMSYQQKLIIE